MTDANKVIHCRSHVIDCSRSRIMGILNVTGDSFSDGGQYVDTSAAIDRGLEMVAQGADIIDVGPESTRPGSQPVAADEQIRRAIPVIEQLSGRIKVPISIDTHNYQVASAALRAGASIINDISALADVRIADLAAQHNAAVVLMHMQGSPATMQKKPHYNDVVAEVLAFLVERAQLARDHGIAKNNIIIDPGIGFGKTLQHNLSLLRHIDRFVQTGFAVLVGASRKRFIGEITQRATPADRVIGTAAVSALMTQAQAAILRVHDITANLEAVKIASAIADAR